MMERHHPLQTLCINSEWLVHHQIHEASRAYTIKTLPLHSRMVYSTRRDVHCQVDGLQRWWCICGERGGGPSMEIRNPIFGISESLIVGDPPHTGRPIDH